MFDIVHFRELTQANIQADRMIALFQTQDDIGVYLRVHLLVEFSLESWIVCASGNKEFFKGFGENLNMDFAAKAQLAMNFGMSRELNKFVKKLNSFRNKRSHQIDNADITRNEIDSLTGLMENGYPPEVVPMRGLELRWHGDPPRVARFEDAAASLRDKFIILYAVLILRMDFEAQMIAENGI